MQRFQIEKNVAKIESVEDGYRVVVTVERQQADVITKEEAEIALTKAMPLFPQRVKFGR